MNLKRAVLMVTLVLAAAAIAVPLVGLRAGAASGTASRAMAPKSRVEAAEARGVAASTAVQERASQDPGRGRARTDGEGDKP